MEAWTHEHELEGVRGQSLSGRSLTGALGAPHDGVENESWQSSMGSSAKGKEV